MALLLITPLGEISYTLEQSRRKTIMIRIEDTGNVRVSAPLYAKRIEIEKFILQKVKWIKAKVTEVSNRPPRLYKDFIEDGQEFLFLGKKHSLKVVEYRREGTQLNFDGEKWTAHVFEQLSPQERTEQIKERFLIWYRIQAKEILGTRLFHHARIMEVAPKEIVIKSQKRLWGSCDFRQQSINLNWQIIMSPLKVLDYVIVHELSHLTEPNHSQRFWYRVEKFMPEFKDCRMWLKTHQRQLMFP